MPWSEIILASHPYDATTGRGTASLQAQAASPGVDRYRLLAHDDVLLCAEPNQSSFCEAFRVVSPNAVHSAGLTMYTIPPHFRSKCGVRGVVFRPCVQGLKTRCANDTQHLSVRFARKLNCLCAGAHGAS